MTDIIQLTDTQLGQVAALQKLGFGQFLEAISARQLLPLTGLDVDDPQVTRSTVRGSIGDHGAARRIPC